MRNWAKWCINHKMRFVVHIANWTVGLFLRIVIMCGVAIDEAIRDTLNDQRTINHEK